MDSVGSQTTLVQRISPKQRLGLWIAVVIAALASPTWLLLAEPVRTHNGGSAAARWALYTTCAWSWLALTAMGALLASTPADAIKLPVWASAAALVGGAAWLIGASVSAGWRSIPTIALVALTAVPAGFALALLAAAPIGRWLAKQRGVAPRPPASLWWFGLGLWHPALWLAWQAKGFIISSLALMAALLAALDGAKLTSTASYKTRRWLPLALWLASLVLLLTGIAMQR